MQEVDEEELEQEQQVTQTIEVPVPWRALLADLYRSQIAEAESWGEDWNSAFLATNCCLSVSHCIIGANGKVKSFFVRILILQS